MNKTNRIMGFSYFSEPKYLVRKQVSQWFQVMRKLGASAVILESDFIKAIPEDVFICAQENELTPIVHFKSELPLARKFNDVAFLLDVYARWGGSDVIFGDKPNTRTAWPTSGWHYENLVDHFLDRFIPLANHAVRIGLTPVMAPLQPGGDYWDTAFLELFLSGLKKRHLGVILDHLILASYGYTFRKSLSWGKGGPENWPGAKPYLTPEDHEDQLGFNNFEWLRAVGRKATGQEFPIIILDAGQEGTQFSEPESQRSIETIQRIYQCISNDPSEILGDGSGSGSVKLFTISLSGLNDTFGGKLTVAGLVSLFGNESADHKTGNPGQLEGGKTIAHYLLLPSHGSGVSDVILNKVRPIIKKFHPTVGFSLEEAVLAQKVSIFPDKTLFTESTINKLRTAGCMVEILPESGIEIATLIQDVN